MQSYIFFSAWTCYSSLKLSDFVGCLDTTDRVPERTAAVVHANVAAAEVEAVSVVAEVVVVVARAGRPIVAVAASTVGFAAEVTAAAGSREKYTRN